jgi:hypothetical protein
MLMKHKPRQACNTQQACQAKNMPETCTGSVPASHTTYMRAHDVQLPVCPSQQPPGKHTGQRMRREWRAACSTATLLMGLASALSQALLADNCKALSSLA